MSYHQPQEIYTFISKKEDYAAVWTFMAFMPNDPGTISPNYIVQDRNGQWYLVSRDLYNTNEQAMKSLDHRYYSDSHETVVML